MTQPDRPAGRGLRIVPGAVKSLALRRGIEVLQPPSLKSAETVARISGLRPEALVAVAYGLLLPQTVLEIAPHGALNIHASLLPRWRGAAPIQRALLAGDAETGISIMQMDAELDSGPLLAQHRLRIAEDDDTGTLHDKLAALGANAIVAALADVKAGRARSVPQPVDGVTYAHKIDKRDTRLDWSRPAVELERAVRAFRPSPGATTRLDGEALKLWRARLAPGGGAPGCLIDRHNAALVVACGTGALEIVELQRQGGRRMGVAEFLHGRALGPGARFE